MLAGVVRWLASCIKPFRRWRLPIIPTEEVEGGDRSGHSLDHFEVGDEVYEAFEQAAFPMEEIAEQRPNAAFSVDPAERERLAAEGNIVQPLKWHLNLPLCNKQILLHCGWPKREYQDCGICTLPTAMSTSLPESWVSSGRIYTGILLK